MAVARVLFDAWHLEFFVPTTVPAAAVRAARRILRRAAQVAVRRAVRAALRGDPVCRPVTFTVSR